MIIRYLMTHAGFVHQKDMPYVVNHYAKPLLDEIERLKAANMALQIQLADKTAECSATAKTAREYWEMLKRRGNVA